MLGALLVAIVGLRVEVLKLGSGVGAQVQQATLLQSANSDLRSQISALSDSQRIIKLAEGYGMHMPNPLDVHILESTAGTHLAAAVKNISEPSRATFLSGLVSEQQTNQANTAAVAATADATTTPTSGAGTATNLSSDSIVTADTAPGGAAAGSTDTGATSGSAGLPAPATDPATADASATQPGTTAAGTTQPGTTAASTTEPGTTDLSTSASTGADSGSADAGTGAVPSGAAAPTGAADTSQTAGSTTASANGGSGLAG